MGTGQAGSARVTGCYIEAIGISARVEATTCIGVGETPLTHVIVRPRINIIITNNRVHEILWLRMNLESSIPYSICIRFMQPPAAALSQNVLGYKSRWGVMLMGILQLYVLE
ncbi:hypothetical protein M404DRAFT_1009361 [Pisolithus tinctorius Marx 270]|uniref:Uncharacterized protein n=1 Tax=Pisolithus tinctorius Marx 270 TaxID=870435 RepID=A0A0C3MV24_PISTI|nr:hypothetical protein M404DRAFT_1009361 [Pisolithus tinctorius Marx 270]